MNYLRKKISESQLLANLEHSSKCGSLKNAFNYNSNNSEDHENVKFAIFKKLVNEGFIVYTEAKFLNNKGIGDIVAIKDGMGWIIEVMHSEKSENLEKKKLKYPQDFILIPVRTHNFKIKEFDL